jgi:hypothetical protein
MYIALRNHHQHHWHCRAACPLPGGWERTEGTRVHTRRGA